MKSRPKPNMTRTQTHTVCPPTKPPMAPKSPPSPEAASKKLIRYIEGGK